MESIEINYQNGVRVGLGVSVVTDTDDTTSYGNKSSHGSSIRSGKMVTGSLITKDKVMAGYSVRYFGEKSSISIEQGSKKKK